jgi:uncharacterized protein (UPF0335 family)
MSLKLKKKSKLGQGCPLASMSEKLTRKKKPVLSETLSLDDAVALVGSTDSWVDEEDFVHVDTVDGDSRPSGGNSIQSQSWSAVDKIEKLKEEKEVLHQDNTSHMKHKWDLECQVDGLKKDKDELEVRNEQLQQMIASLQGSLEEALSKVKDLEEQNHKLNSDIETHQKVYDDVTMRHANKMFELESKNQQLVKQIAELEEANGMFLMLAQDVKEGLWRAKEKNQSNETVQVFSALSDHIPESFSNHDSPPPTPLGDLPEGLSPPTLQTLVEYVPEVAPRWEYLGHELGLSNRTLTLKDEALCVERKCLHLVEEWVQVGNDVSWQRLLRALTSSGVRLHRVAVKIHQNLLPPPQVSLP